MQKNSQIPKDYEELWHLYVEGSSSLTNQILRTILPTESDETRRDLAQDVFTRCLEHKMIERFDPSKSNFGGVIFFVTRSVAANYLGRKSRNPLGTLNAGSLTTEEQDDETFEPGAYSLDRLFTTDPKAEENLDTKARFQKLLDVADNQPKNNKRGQSLGKLVRLLLEGNDTDECGAALGVTRSTIHNWMNFLAQEAR